MAVAAGPADRVAAADRAEAVVQVAAVDTEVPQVRRAAIRLEPDLPALPVLAQETVPLGMAAGMVRVTRTPRPPLVEPRRLIMPTSQRQRIRRTAAKSSETVSLLTPC